MKSICTLPVLLAVMLVAGSVLATFAAADIEHDQMPLVQEARDTVAARPSPPGLQELQAVVRTRLEIERPAVGDAGPIEAGVDDRMELLTIIFRLAGAPEFTSGGFAPYATAVDARFAPYAEHEAVKFARRMREEVGVGGDGVVVLAAHLAPLPSLDPPESFNATAVEGRWRGGDARHFASLARDFARESGFSDFLDQCRPVYELAALRMRKLVKEEIEPGWFAEYFGERPNSRMRVAVGLLNGNISYGFDVRRAGQPDELFAVIGTWRFDELQLPVYESSIIPTLVHEFCHSFVDPAVLKRASDFKAAGTALQEVLARHLPRMRQYFWRTLFEESIVRAAVARYLLTHKGAEAAHAELAQQVNNGFAWIHDLYAILAEYEQNRDLYPTFEMFLPRILDFFTQLPDQLPGIVKEDGPPAPTKSP